ncbi:MAG TPA: hypothetical protein DCK79_03715, partial [Candidatus Atribacteria bacterium]|nr:hypothetical protein [Candidatus Atribacteria bacterium]
PPAPLPIGGYCVWCKGLKKKKIPAYVEQQKKENKGQRQLTFPWFKDPPTPGWGIFISPQFLKK